MIKNHDSAERINHINVKFGKSYLCRNRQNMKLHSSLCAGFYIFEQNLASFLSSFCHCSKLARQSEFKGKCERGEEN